MSKQNEKFSLSWAYVGGFFDGEGSVYFAKPQKPGHNATVQLIFTNTNRAVLDLIRERLGCGKVYLGVPTKYTKNVCWHLMVSRHEDVASVARQLVDYCFVKREKLLRAIEHIKNAKWAYSHSHRKSWSEEEIAYLKAFYASANRQDIMRKLGRTWESIKCEALKLGLRREVRMVRLHGHFWRATPIATREMGVEVKTG